MEDTREGREDVRHPFTPVPRAAIEETKMIRPQFWVFMSSIRHLTRRKEAVRFIFRVYSNSSNEMSL